MASQYDGVIEALKKNPEIRKAVVELSRTSFWRQMLPLAFDWAVILAVAGLCEAYFHPFVYAVGVVIIACRQHALLVGMHEAAHQRISKHGWLNDLASDWLGAYPALMSTAMYRKNHLEHHHFTNTDKDPDWTRKIPFPDWHYPQTKSQAAGVLGKTLLIGGLQWMVLAWRTSWKDPKKMAYFAACAVGITVLGIWPQFLLYWAVPLLTLFPTIQRIRSIAEHFALPHEHELNETRNVIPSAFERFLFSPHNVGYHLDHHLFPSVPQYNLKALHRKLNENETYVRLAHNNDGYFFSKKSVWAEMTAPAMPIQQQKQAA